MHYSRRNMLGTGAVVGLASIAGAAAAATPGNPDEPPHAGISHQKFCRHSLLARRDVMLDPS